MPLRNKDFEPDLSSERKYSVALQRKAIEIANKLKKAKSVKDIDAIIKRYGNNPQYLKWAESVAKQLYGSQNFKSKRIWRMYFKETRGKAAKKLSSRLTKLIEKINLDDLIKENEKVIKSFPETMGKMAKAKYRSLVKENVTGGKRASEIAKYLKSVGINRADLIARTETGKAQTEITKRRSENIGLKGYVWKTSMDRRVRYSHRSMRNVICFWDDKPVPGIYDLPKNDRAVAPGEDFNCRCLSVVIVEANQVRKLSSGGSNKVWKNGKITKLNTKKLIELLGVEDNENIR